MAKLLEQTLDAMKHVGQGIKDVAWVGTRDFHTTWAQFAKEVMDYEYSDGFGGAEVEGSLKVVFHDGTWLERGEYDGSEWWAYKKLPTQPEVTLEQLRETPAPDPKYHPHSRSFPWGYNRELHGSKYS